MIGSIPYDHELIIAGLSRHNIGEFKALEGVERIVERLEQVVSLREERGR